MKKRRLSSYQRRLRNIEFYKQRGEDLEAYILQLLKDRKAGVVKPVVPIMLQGISGDRILNDIGSGEFFLMIINRLEVG